MSAVKGKTYIDTIQSYLNPRIYIALNLGNKVSEYNVIDYSTISKKIQVIMLYQYLIQIL